MQHQVIKLPKSKEHPYRYSCEVCRWRWTSKPQSNCPGLPRYIWYDAAAAAGLATKTQLRRDGYKLAPDQEPVGCILSGPRSDIVLLYERSKAIKRKQATPKQLEALERGRTTADQNRRRCRYCKAVQQSYYDLANCGICDDCFYSAYD